MSRTESRSRLLNVYLIRIYSLILRISAADYLIIVLLELDSKELKIVSTTLYRTKLLEN
jgi:hypothetical protein